MNWKKKMLNVQDFAHANRKLLVIVADPQDDTLFVSYNDKQVTGKIKSIDGLEYNVVKNLLKNSTFERSRERFIGALVDVIKTPITVQQISDFYKFISDAVWKITKSLKFTKK